LAGVSISGFRTILEAGRVILLQFVYLSDCVIMNCRLGVLKLELRHELMVEQ
jgi:hypothetical protein